MANEHQFTDIELVLYRGRIIFFVLFSLCIALFISALYTGLESGELQKKITSVGKKWADFQKSLETKPLPTPMTLPHYQLPTETEQEPTPTDIPAPKQQINYYYYTYPTSKPYPTIVPGQPGSKEWEEEFQRKWNSYSSGSTTSTYSFPTPKPGDLGSQEWKDNFDKQYNETKAQIEAGQKEFCQKNPSLSFCK